MKNISTERESIKLLKNGDVRGFEFIYKKYYHHFYLFCLRFVKDETIAEDIIQDIFMDVWQKRESLDETQSICAYLFVLSKYKIFNYYRTKQSHVYEEISNRLLDISSSQDIEHDYCEKEFYHLTIERINKLPPKRRMSFILSRFEHLSAQEIAIKLGVSRRTVEKNIELAMKDLRKKMFSILISIFFLTIW